MNKIKKKSENNKKNKIIKSNFKHLIGCVININIINFPSLPPIIFRENNNKDIKNVKKKMRIFKIISNKNDL